MFTVINGRKISAVLAVLILAQLAVTVYICADDFALSKTSPVDFTVVIDAGHGGIDGGVVGADGTKESDLNLQYANTLGKEFETAGFNVVYTRRGANGLYGLPTKGFKRRDMLARKQVIDKASPNLVISVHMNKFSDSCRSGAQVFFQKGNDEGEMFAQSVQACLNDLSGNTHSALSGDFFVCREVSCPSIIAECGFVSNAAELALLKTDDYRNKICRGIFKGAMLYLCKKD